MSQTTIYTLNHGLEDHSGYVKSLIAAKALEHANEADRSAMISGRLSSVNVFGVPRDPHMASLNRTEPVRRYSLFNNSILDRMILAIPPSYYGRDALFRKIAYSVLEDRFTRKDPSFDSIGLAFKFLSDEAQDEKQELEISTDPSGKLFWEADIYYLYVFIAAVIYERLPLDGVNRPVSVKRITADQGLICIDGLFA